MEFLKKHYEKVLLSVVLLCLAGAAAYLPIKIKQNQREIQDALNPPPPPAGGEAIKPTDLDPYRAVLATNHTPLVLAAPHNLFNPVTWKRMPDGRVIKVRTGDEIGAGALRVTQIEPLRLRLTFEGISGTGESRRYVVGVTREADPNRSVRRKTSKFVSLGSALKGDPFLVQAVVGSEDTPTGLMLSLMDTKERVTITKDSPFERIEGYRADLRYEPENKTFRDVRQMSQSSDAREYQLEFGSERYNIVAISEKDVTVSAISTTKRTTIPYKPPMPKS